MVSASDADSSKKDVPANSAWSVVTAGTEGGEESVEALRRKDGKGDENEGARRRTNVLDIWLKGSWSAMIAIASCWRCVSPPRRRRREAFGRNFCGREFVT